MHLVKAAAVVIVLLTGSVAGCATFAETSASVVDFETPLSRLQPLQGYLRQPSGAGPSPAVVLLHSCNGNAQRLDERWGRRIAGWGYVTLTVDSFGPRGLKNTCSSGAVVDLALDAYRALGFLVQQRFVDSSRVAVLGFSQAPGRHSRRSSAASSNRPRRTNSAPLSPSIRTASASRAT